MVPQISFSRNHNFLLKFFFLTDSSDHCPDLSLTKHNAFHATKTQDFKTEDPLVSLYSIQYTTAPPAQPTKQLPCPKICCNIWGALRGSASRRNFLWCSHILGIVINFPRNSFLIGLLGLISFLNGIQWCKKSVHWKSNPQLDFLDRRGKIYH